MNAAKSPCAECKHFTEGPRPDRCQECLDWKDYELLMDGQSPYHRKFNKFKPGFEPREGLEHMIPEESKTCPDCGRTFAGDAIIKNFSAHTKTADGLTRLCSQCFGGKIREGHLKRKPGISGQLLTLNFKDRPELYDKLTQAAGRNFRQAPEHALFLISEALKK
jgi:hypothetical protein